MTATELTYLFMDTEWADSFGHELVSMALVTADGRHVFYVERDPLPCSPTEFVRRVVYPLLNRGVTALPDAAMTKALRSFLAKFDHPHVLADHPKDVQQLRRVLDGTELSAAESLACGPKPSIVATVMDRQGMTTTVLEQWFASHPGEAARRHHALVDAYALRIAWLVSTGRVSVAWFSGTNDPKHS